MESVAYTHLPLVSVVIPCFNHGPYLQQAIDSVLNQAYPNLEIIVVDDGSTDNTKDVATQNKEVKYVFQHNQGLSAARNTGIRNSTGDFLVFLDADDYLYKEACTINLEYLLQNQQVAFVSGSHDKIREISGQTLPSVTTVSSDHYLHLLKGNYIGMHATVMYRKWVFEDFLYDTTLKACEDYDLYLRVARKHPVLHHENRIAAYVLHESNMSNNIPLMLSTALRVLERQKKQLVNESEVAAYSEGRKIWKAYYLHELSAKLETGKKISLKDYYTLLRYNPSLALYKVFRGGKSKIKW